MKRKEKIFKKGSTTYYYTSLFFPADVREDIMNLYAFVRTMDDYVDQKKPQKQQLSTMWKLTKDAWNKKAKVSNGIVSDFVKTAKKHNFDWLWIEAFYHTMLSDVTVKKYKTYRDLEKYMYGSAEVIGLMMAKILGLPSQATKAAQLQGKAMQLINFVRDVEEDKQLGRTYIPQDEIEKGLSFQIDRYRDIQRQAQQGYAFIPKKYLIPIKTAAEMYSWTADRIERDPNIVTKTKVKPGRLLIFAFIIKNYLLIR